MVTGGAVRVGRGISLALAEAGCDVLVHYGSSADAAEATAGEAAARGVRAEPFAADLSDRAAADSVVPAAVDALGGVDLLVNSAAIFPAGGLLETDDELWQTVFDVNLRAPFILSRAFARHRAERQAQHRDPAAESEGAIVNILDARIFRPAADHFAYRLTKVALHAMTEGLAHELAPGIRVNAVALGAILPAPGDSPEAFERLVEERVPLRRPGSPEIVADNVVHLLRQSFLTGVTIRVDGAEFL